MLEQEVKRMKCYLSISSFFLGIILLCHSCEKVSSPTYPILLTADSTMWSNPDSALLLLEQIPAPAKLKVADRAFYALLLTQARYKSCTLLKNDSLIQMAVDYYEESSEKELLGKSYFYLGCAHLEKNELPKANDFFLKSLNIMSQGDDSIFVAMIYSHLGICYNEQDLHATARKMYKKGYNLCIEQDSARAGYILDDIGDTFFVEYQLDSALFYYERSLQIGSSLQHANLLSAVYKDMAGLYNEQGKYTEAELCISKSLFYTIDREDYVSVCSTKGDILNSLNKKDSATYYWNIGVTSSNLYVKASSYNCLFQEYKIQKDFGRATLCADSFIVFYDSIQVMNDRAELDKLMDNHLVELHKHELSVNNQRIIAALIIMFMVLLLALITSYFWRDRIRQKKYMSLQHRLMENRVEVLLLNDKPESPNDELYKLEEERLKISISLFKTTEGYKRLNELNKATPRLQIRIANVYREVVMNDIRSTFAEVMMDLKNHYSSLTNDDLFYGVLSLLRCPKTVILHILDASPDALKVRKNRIKNKIDAEMFNHIFNY